MPKRPRAYYRPESLDEALQLLAQPDTAPLAGGTQLLASEAGTAVAVVDLQALGLNQVSLHDDRLQVGATVTLTGLDTFLRQHAPNAGATALLRETIRRAGPNTYRNAATLGGSVAGRLPDSELLAALLVLNAEITLHAPQPQTMLLADYLAAAEQPAGLITILTIAWHNGEGVCERVARTPADYPIVSVTVWTPTGGKPRLAATGIAEQPLRLPAAEAALSGGLDAASITAAAAAAQSAAVHPGDFRGDAAYRADMVAVLTRRALQVNQ